MLFIASKSMKSDKTREKFEKDLSSLLFSAIVRGRSAFLGSKGPSEVDIKNFAQYFSVLALFLKDLPVDPKGSGRRAAASAMARDFSLFEPSLPFESDEPPITTIYGGDKLRSYIRKKAAYALSAVRAETRLPFSSTHSTLQWVLSELQ